MHEAITTLEDNRTAALPTRETARVSDNETRVAPEATARAYSALTERPADFMEIFAPTRRPFVAAAVTYKALKQPPLDFNRMDLLAPRRRGLAEQAVPTYRALTEPTADFTEIMTVAEIIIIPEIVATPQELEALLSQAAEQTASSGKPLAEPPAGFARRESLFAPAHHPPVVARRTPQRTD